MEFKTIDMKSYPRREQFELFRHMAYPYAGLTADIDVLQVREFTRKFGHSFFLTMNYILAKAANRIPEFRMRIHGDGIIEYACCGTSHTILLPDNTFCYCTLYHGKDFPEYIHYATAEQQRAMQTGWVPDDEETDGLYFVTSIPWVHYSNLVQPVPCSEESNPRISFGKYEEIGGNLMMPLTVLVHHALADGYHLGLFYRYVEEEMALLVAPV